MSATVSNYAIGVDPENPQATETIIISNEKKDNESEKSFSSEISVNPINPINPVHSENSDNFYNIIPEITELIDNKDKELMIDLPSIEFTYVPPLGNRVKNLKGKVHNIDPEKFAVVVYIYVSEWRLKPYLDSPLTPINNDGSWGCDITTRGYDQKATTITAFVVEKGFNVPELAENVNLSTVYASKGVHTKAEVSR